MRLIDADKLIEVFAVKKEVWRGNGVLPSNESLMWLAAMDITSNAPTVDAVPVKHGKWFDAMVGELPVQVCDQCSTFFPLAYTGGGHHYCPHCGAKMDLEEQHDD